MYSSRLIRITVTATVILGLSIVSLAEASHPLKPGVIGPGSHSLPLPAEAVFMDLSHEIQKAKRAEQPDGACFALENGVLLLGEVDCEICLSLPLRVAVTPDFVANDDVFGKVHDPSVMGNGRQFQPLVIAQRKALGGGSRSAIIAEGDVIEIGVAREVRVAVDSSSYADPIFGG